MVYQQRFEEAEKAIKQKKKELEQAKKRIAELDRIFKRIYEDDISGTISFRLAFCRAIFGISSNSTFPSRYTR